MYSSNMLLTETSLKLSMHLQEPHDSGSCKFKRYPLGHWTSLNLAGGVPSPWRAGVKYFAMATVLNPYAKL